MTAAHPQGGDPDIATVAGITERSAYGIVADLTDAGYVVKEKDGRRNRYQIQKHMPLRDSISREAAIGEVLDVLVPSKLRRRTRTRRPEAAVTGKRGGTR